MNLDEVKHQKALVKNVHAPMQHDVVSHPRHYTSNVIECIEITEHLSFNLGNAVKYLWRAGLKDHEDIDLQKAGWYLDREAERVARSWVARFRLRWTLFWLLRRPRVKYYLQARRHDIVARILVMLARGSVPYVWAGKIYYEG